MTRYGRRTIAFAVGLAVLAGYVDAFGFIILGGFFVSFMSGNSTRFGVGLGGARLVHSITAVSLIGLFVTGVIVGSVLGTKFNEKRKVVILATVTLLLTSAVILSLLSSARITACPLAIAMGVLNTVFERDGEVSIGVTYMTGALVKMGQRLAGALLGGPKWTWAPYAVLWLGLVSGACLGTVAYHRSGIAALWIAAAYSGLMILIAPRLR